MIRRNKRITCLTATVLTLSVISVTPQAATMGVYSNDFNNSQEDESACINCKKSTDENGIIWEYHVRDDGNATLMGTFEPQEDMIVPQNIDGHKVDKIAKLVEETSRSQSDYGVRSATPKSIVIPEGVTYIGPSALNYKNLNDVELPSSIKVMSSYSMNTAWNDAHRDENGFVVYNGILVDGRNVSGDVVISDNITCIGDNAFEGNTKIKSVSIPSSVKRVGKNAFFECENLNKVKIEDGVEVIGREAFARDYKLESVKVPSSIKEIGYDAFAGNLSSSSSDNETESGSSEGLIIGDGVLISAKDAKGDIVIPSSVTKIQSKAFYNNQNIKSVKIPDSVTEIGEIAFAGSSITSVNIPGSVKTIPDTAFEMCTKLENVEIGDGVKIVSHLAFSACRSLKEINLPSSVTRIEGAAFRGCKNLETFNYGENIEITDGAFLGTKFDGVIVSRGTVPDEEKKEDDANNDSNKSDKRGWSKEGDYWYYYDNDGVKLSGFQTIDSRNYYFYSTGEKAIGVVDLGNSSLIYADPSDNSNNGALLTGWKKINGDWYYFNTVSENNNPVGVNKTGWLYDNGCWYYFYSTGQMATGFINLGDNALYYLDESNTSSIGIMRTGWQKINGYWYYFNTSSDNGVEGMMRFGWQEINGKWYYFYSTGEMAESTYINGYYVNYNGEWV